MAAQCAKLIAERDDFVLATIVHHDASQERSSEVQRISNKLKIPHLSVGNVNATDTIEMLDEVNPDIVFSVNNWDVIRTDLLKRAGDGIINFHNGPLPEYRGVNVPSWAIINREKRHGVSWHFVAEKIDAGDIVASKNFDLSPRETATSLTVRCINEGLALFPPLLDRYVSGNLVAWPQTGEGHYFSAKDSPPNQGFLDFNQEFQELSALVRGLSFRPFDNRFVWPKTHAGGRTLLISGIEFYENRLEGEAWTCGEVRKVDDRGIVVRARDGLVRISGLMDDDLRELTPRELMELYNLNVGSMLM